MPRLTKDRTLCRTNRPLRASRWLPSRRFGAGCGERLLLALLCATTLAGILILSACGSGSSSTLQANVSLSGNWQFTMAPPGDGSFLGGLQGGFVVQSGSSATGAAAYAVSSPQLPIPCNTGSAAITGTISGQDVTITAVAGTQTFTLTGTLSFNGTQDYGSTFVGETMVGTYNSTAGTAADGFPCGTEQTGLQWSAVLVPPMTGGIQGSFHSTDATTGLNNQDFLLTGSLTQAANTGASSAVVTGTLNFTSQASDSSGYPCFDTASIYGQISGSSVTLQIVGASQAIVGLIGAPAGTNGTTGLNPVAFVSSQGGYILNGVGPSYLVATSACPGSTGNTGAAGDYGDMCLSVGSPLGTANACQQPFSLTPTSLTFPALAVGKTATQAISLVNQSNGALNGMVLAVADNPANATNFSETDNCGFEGVPSLGQPFALTSGQACTITVTFAPQSASPLSATLNLTSPVSADNDTVFAVPIVGTGVSGDADVERYAEID